MFFNLEKDFHWMPFLLILNYIFHPNHFDTSINFLKVEGGLFSRVFIDLPLKNPN